MGKTGQDDQADHPSQSNINWRAILWLEKQTCADRDYASHLRRILVAEPISWVYYLKVRRQMRPYIGDVEAALQVACHHRWSVKYLWAKRLARLDQAKAKSPPIDKLIAGLQENHWFERFVARHMVYHRGGEAVPDLLALAQSQQATLANVANWLLEGIATETTARLADTDYLCTACFAHHQPQQIALPSDTKVTYYACRICGQSTSFTSWSNGVVAVLNQAMRPKKQIENEQVRVNWLKHRTYFDFDRVEIIQANDEEVERFAMQLGNDPSPEHKAARKKVTCTIFPTCHLSENSLRILQATFKQVEVTRP